MNIVTRLIRDGLSYFPHIGIVNILEILIIAYIVYEIMAWIGKTRAWTLLKGLLIIVGFTVVSYILRFDVILWIMGRIATIAVTALIIIFAPELRKALEQLGNKNIMNLFTFDSKSSDDGMSERTVDELINAAFTMSKPKTGALIVIERNENLAYIEKTGILINGIVSSQLLINIFEHNTPLHDGAVLIRGNTVVSATCYLPLSENMRISKDLGTRHRAAIGISEVSDSITIVVSEETGRVSVAIGGNLIKVKDKEGLKRELSVLLEDRKEDKNISLLSKLLKGRGNDKDK
ncbi:TIGR00159 family protein [Lachnoanaerobaculum saburreum F0468]|jgi:TIGR00159 family protein|uniref:Diadenylate cyclase n=1 Tax=Lachnoanaerobaculum saburreum F0468 TaxID=1095750 RepID=I0RBD0_9FIRM|nr:diadenylate cyclase CdaA [Lachnoanaerobaculum saburreum]EIC96988.1 TIGR00159 family protein [Lachnoanaerobaculum saburreum F0468]RKW51541.1 MAG: TIGR00159 family protein [Lachnospiraceae bacterium]